MRVRARGLSRGGRRVSCHLLVSKAPGPVGAVLPQPTAVSSGPSGLCGLRGGGGVGKMLTSLSRHPTFHDTPVSFLLGTADNS